MAPAPTLIYLHGGGYSTGTKRLESRHLIHRMAGRGWVVVSANYGLRPRVGYPEHLIDAKRIIAWIHREAERYGMAKQTIETDFPSNFTPPGPICTAPEQHSASATFWNLDESPTIKAVAS